MDSFYSMYNKKKRNNISFFSKIIIYNQFKNSHGNIFQNLFLLSFIFNSFYLIYFLSYQIIIFRWSFLSIYKYNLFMNYCCLYESPKMSVFVLRMNHIFATSSLILFKIWFLFSFCCCCCCFVVCCLFFKSFLVVFCLFILGWVGVILFLSRFLCILLGLNVWGGSMNVSCFYN